MYIKNNNYNFTKLLNSSIVRKISMKISTYLYGLFYEGFYAIMERDINLLTSVKTKQSLHGQKIRIYKFIEKTNIFCT